MNNRRIVFDVIKGVSIMIVVFYHVCNNLDYTLGQNICNYLCLWMLPPFFFTSGYFAIPKDTSNSGLMLSSIKKAVQLLIPTIIIGFVFVYFLNGLKGLTLTEVVFDNFRGGYWFPFVLFELFIVTYFLIALNRQILSLTRRRYLAYSIIIFSIVILLMALVVMRKTSLGLSLSAVLVLMYIPSFVIGMIYRRYETQMGSLLQSKGRIFILFLLTFLIAYAGGKYPSVMPVAMIIGLFAFTGVIFRNESRLSNSKIWLAISYIGTISLPIYLIHYYPLKAAICYLKPITDLYNPIIQLLLSVIISAAIISICILVYRLMDGSGMAKIVFPRGSFITRLQSQKASEANA